MNRWAQIQRPERPCRQRRTRLYAALLAMVDRTGGEEDGVEREVVVGVKGEGEPGVSRLLPVPVHVALHRRSGAGPSLVPNGDNDDDDNKALCSHPPSTLPVVSSSSTLTCASRVFAE